MRKVLEDKRLRGVKVMDGLSTNIPLPDESVDAVIIAQVGRFLLLTAHSRLPTKLTASHPYLQVVNEIRFTSSPCPCAKRLSW